MLITRLLLVLEVWDGKPTSRKSWAKNLLIWSDLTSGFSKVKHVLIALVGFLYGGYNLHWFCDAIGLVSVCYSPILRSAIT